MKISKKKRREDRSTGEQVKGSQSNDVYPDTNDSVDVVVNVDTDAWQAARERARAAQRSRDVIRSQAREINNLKCEMHEIKDMLQTLLDR